MTLEQRLVESLRKSAWYWPAGILILCAALYSQTFSFDLVSDDQLQIKENVNIRSWTRIGKAFTEHAWSGQKDYSITNSYRPFYIIWLTANYGLFAEKPAGWHLTAVLAYLSAVVAVWCLAREMLESGVARVAATILFALHPLHVESVAWIAAAADSLVVTFFCWATVFYFRSTPSHTQPQFETVLPRRIASSWISAGFLLLCLATKEFAVFWLPMVAAYEVLARRPYLLNHSLLKTVGALLNVFFPHLVVLGLYFTARKLALPGVLAGNPDLSPQAVLFTAPWVAVNYVQLLLFPVNLRMEYELGYVLSPADPRFWGSAAVLALLAGTICYFGKTRRELWVYAVWIFLPLLPTFNLWHFRMDEFMHDRYLFLPSLGFSLLFGWWIGQRKTVAGEETEGTETVETGIPKRQLLFLTAVVVVALPLNLVFIPVWKNDFTLYQHILKYHPNNAFAIGNLSNAFHRIGDYESEVFLITRIIPSRPNQFIYPYTLAAAQARLNRFAEVVETLEPVERGDPQFVFHVEDQARLGVGYLQTGRPREAVRRFEALVAANPGNPGYWILLGESYGGLNRFADARRAFQNALTINPKLEPDVRRKIDRFGQK